MRQQPDHLIDGAFPAMAIIQRHDCDIPPREGLYSSSKIGYFPSKELA